MNTFYRCAPPHTDRNYEYDGNGNVIEEREGAAGSGVDGRIPYYYEEGLYHAEYGFALTNRGPDAGEGDGRYKREYRWDYRNQMIRSDDGNQTMRYVYGGDGQRAVKYNEKNGHETLYFNNMLNMSLYTSEGWLMSKHVFVGESRVVTKYHYDRDVSGNYGYEMNHQYWYHGDHLGSAQVVTDHAGNIYERIEYTPYGEVWVEDRGSGHDVEVPYRFTGKELDSETGLYYYGARYLDPKRSRWLSGDPAMGEYIPSAPINEEARKRNGNLPGMGGVFNVVNLHAYHYAGNNPVKYTDPDGRDFLDILIRLFSSYSRGEPPTTEFWNNTFPSPMPGHYAVTVKTSTSGQAEKE
jgi:RHS repeat-associated protein